MSSTTSASASASAASSSAASGSLTANSNLKIVGILLAVASGLLIGSSFVFKKKGLLRSQAGAAAGEGVAYLKSPLWWLGMTMMIIGEICNFAAYAFVEAIVVTPLGALSVVICAILSSIFLKEKLSFFGWLGCALCIIGSVVIALNGPQEQTVGQITEFQKLFLAPGFLAYAGVLIASSLTIVFYFAPRYGKKSMLWYIMVCSMIGGISVSVTTGLGAAIVTTAQGDNQFKHWFLYFLAGFVIITLVTEVYYLNVALALFNTAMVTPTYYVIFTFFSMVTTIVLFQGLKASATQILTIVMGFLTICLGITILQMSKVDPKQLKKLDRRSTILLEAAKQQTESVEEKDMLGVEDPGMDALRGSFGTVGSIIRAKSARRMSQSSHTTAYRPRTLPPGAGYPHPPHQSWVSDRMTASPPPDGVDGMKRHQLYDAPMPGTPGSEIDAFSMRSTSFTGSQIMNKRPTIKFGSQDMVHEYRPTKEGQADAKHEHRAALGSPSATGEEGAGYPPQPPLRERTPSNLGAPPLVDVDDEIDQSIGKLVTVPPHLRGEKDVQTAPQGGRFGGANVVRGAPGRADSREIFSQRDGMGESPSAGTLLSFPSVTDSARSLVWEEGGNAETGSMSSVSKGSKDGERGRKGKRYPKGNGDDDRDESVSLVHSRGAGSGGGAGYRDDGEDDDEDEDEPTLKGNRGGIRLVPQQTASGRF